MTPTSTAALLDRVASFVRRFVVLRGEVEAVALALWILHSYAVEAAAATPYLYVGSAEKQSGKSRLLEILAALCARAQHVANVSEAALYRVIEKHRPTLLIDEIDALFQSNGERTEALRGILNAGNRRGSCVLRCLQGSEVQRLSTFGPKVLAGIDNGTLPDTIRDRCIPIRMRRRTRAEAVERLLWQDVEDETRALREQFEQWATVTLDALSAHRPDLPEQLSDRAAEGWWPLLSIADVAGDTWPTRARAAALELSAGADQEDNSRGVQLLADLRGVFEAKRRPMFTSELLTALNALEESPWGSYRRGDGLDPRGLAKLLKPYEIKSRSVRVGDETAKGYHRESFEDAWTRYTATPQEPSRGSQGSQPAAHGDGDVTDVTDVTDSREAEVIDRLVREFDAVEDDVAQLTLQPAGNGAR